LKLTYPEDAVDKLDISWGDQKGARISTGRKCKALNFDIDGVFLVESGFAGKNLELSSNESTVVLDITILATCLASQAKRQVENTKTTDGMQKTVSRILHK